MKPDGVRSLFRLVPLIKYFKKLISKTDTKMFDSIKIYLIVFVIISTIFNIFSVNYMSNQAVIISKYKSEADDTKEFINCIENETSSYGNFVMYRDVPEGTLVKRIRKCIYIYKLKNKKRSGNEFE